MLLSQGTLENGNMSPSGVHILTVSPQTVLCLLRKQALGPPSGGVSVLAFQSARVEPFACH